ncbi:MAG: cytochrome c peroxidase [Hyphomicrobiaceae bacterium]
MMLKVSTALVRSAMVALVALMMGACDRSPLTTEESAVVATLALGALPALPSDPSNIYADNKDVAAFGKKLFGDTRLSLNGKVACATCHLPERQFQDDKPLAVAVGTGVRRTMPLAGVAWGPWFFWDGRKDSQWSQALGPLEDQVEHGSDRTTLVFTIATHYRQTYETLFGPLTDLPAVAVAASPVGTIAARRAWDALTPAERTAINRGFANIGKAIAAHGRTLKPEMTRFDRFAASHAQGNSAPDNARFTQQEIAGLKLFLGKGSCTNCHSGPRLTDDHFHNTGVPAVPGLPPDGGRATVLKAIGADPFNCLGAFSDATPDQCGELRFMSQDRHALTRAYKPPSLRRVSSRPPYMHAGQFPTLDAVIAHYASAPRAPAGHSELKPLDLSDQDRQALVAFLKTLEP